MEQPYVTLSVKNEVGTIEFYHPAHNAMPSDVLLKLQQTIVKADADTNVKVIILKSGGDRTFAPELVLTSLSLLQIKKKESYFLQVSPMLLIQCAPVLN